MVLALGAAHNAWGWYQHQLAKRPMRTQIVTSGILWGLGDGIAQRLDATVAMEKKVIKDDLCLSSPHRRGEKTKEPEWMNWRRLMTTSLYGAAFIGPVGHRWYERLDLIVTQNLLLRPNTINFIAAKLLADTLLFGPIHLVAFFAFTGLAEGKAVSQVKREVVRDFVPAFLMEGTFWPIVQAANFRFVPVRHQLLFVNACCLFDSIFLSWLKHQADAPWKKWLASSFGDKTATG
ncbi:hypothetical protein CBR_g20451 [Chara braunii]|uniref:Peroxisomal membrane protein MPV17 n=1 Tax=Chara braunii TaxID=69332 RepID=A0A388JUG4_CHABU|nr:hypothetical protein CBR_g20451 [Chara braunii]|eukprot:GBG61420.1 hypothetical protein CBR_g20451 [Chara braunii]